MSDDESHDPGDLTPDIPQVDIPEVDIPEVDGPSPPSATIPEVETDPSEVPTRLQIDFWRLVLIFNFALFVTSLGVMLIVFNQQWEDGLHLIGLGVTAFLYGVREYKKAKERMDTN